MSQFLFIAIVAGLVAFVGTPFTLILAHRVGLVAVPNARKTHSVPTPLLGGLAIWAAFVVSLLIFGRETQFRELAAIILGGTVITAVGLVDDRVGLGPVPKLLGQALAAATLIVGGVQAELFAFEPLNIGLTMVWVVGICNALNYQDNMDGLAAGVSAVAAGSFLLLAALNGQVLVASLAAALLGACLGFLVYNFQPAISFMGDTGALLLGFMLAVLGIKLSFPATDPLSTWMAPIVVLGLPIFDTALVTLSRWRRRAPVMQGGADHTSHRLARLGLSHRRVVIALYSVCAALGLFAVLLTQSEPWLANTLFGGLSVFGLLVLWLLEEVYRMPAPARYRPDLRLTVIAGGEAMLPLLEGAATVSRTVTLLVTPGEGQLPPGRLRACLPLLSDDPASVRRVLEGSAAFGEEVDLLAQVALARRVIRLQGRLVVTTDPLNAVREEAVVAVRQTDLIVIGGDLHENVLPTLKLESIQQALRRSKRARVLAHPDPQTALREIERAAGPGLITHVIDAGTMIGADQMWHTAADPGQGSQVAEALNQIWLQRTKARGAPQPISGSLYG